MRILPVVLLAGCSLTTLMTQKKSWPDDDGTLTGQKVTAEVQIHRDEWGIAHIRAQNESDMWFAQGFVHARDRLFQADLARRLVFGGLVELRGEAALPLERFMRGMELESRSMALYEAAPPELKAQIDRYTEGFNAGMASLKALPVEHRLSNTTPAPWQPWHCMAMVWLNAWTLAENYGVEIAAIQMQNLDARMMDALFRFDATEPPVGAEWDVTRTLKYGAFTQEFKAFDDVLGYHAIGQGSNNWVVGPSRTASKSAIVANDPHLSQRVPSLWYPVDVGSPELHVAGVSLAGSPFVILGHSESVAWAFTNVMADMVDLAILDRSGDGYILNGEKKEFRKVKVEIPLKSGVDTSEQLWTELGPVITHPDAEHVVVLQWQAFSVADHTTQLISGLNHATSAAQAIEATQVHTMIAQNLVVADTDNHYAWQPFGSFPKRKTHDGRMPYHASPANTGWDGWLPPIPGERDHERGYSATANSRPLTLPDAWKVSTHFIDDSRKRRIDEVLSSRNDHTLDTLAALQYDRIDTRGRELSQALLDGTNPTDPQALACKQLLSGWNGDSSPESVAATIWNHLQVALVKEALQSRLTPDQYLAYLAAAGPGWSFLDHDIDYFLPERAKSVETALAATCQSLTAQLGADSSQWTWGKMHPLNLNHPFAGASSLLDSWSIPTTAYGGSPDTVNAASIDWRDAANQSPFAVGSIASMRLLMPLDDLAHSRFVHPGGAYGQPNHPHAYDMFPLWRDGQYATFWYADADVIAHSTTTFVLGL